MSSGKIIPSSGAPGLRRKTFSDGADLLTQYGSIRINYYPSCAIATEHGILVEEARVRRINQGGATTRIQGMLAREKLEIPSYH